MDPIEHLVSSVFLMVTDNGREIQVGSCYNYKSKYVASMQTVDVHGESVGRREEAGLAEAPHRIASEQFPQHSGINFFGAARDSTSKNCTHAPLYIFSALKLLSLISIS